MLKAIKDFFSKWFEAIQEAQMERARQHVRFHSKGLNHWE